MNFGRCSVIAYPTANNQPKYRNMELNVNRKRILEALSGVSSVAAKNATLPILECVKVNVREDGTMVVTAFDLEVSVMRKFKIADSYETAFDFCINPRDFANILKTLRDEDVTLKVDDANCVIVHAKGEVSLPILPAVDYPEVGKDNNIAKLSVDSATLFEWLKNAVKFVASDKLRPMICGVYMYVDGLEFGVAASDGLYLFTDNNRANISEPMNANATLGTKAVSPLLDMLNGTDDVMVMFGERMLSFRTSNAMLSCIKPVGAFPKFKALIMPRENTITVNIDKKELMDSVSRAIMTARVDTTLLRLKAEGNTFTVSSEDLMFSKKSREDCPCTIEGGSIEIGVRGSNLVDCLNAIECENIVMEFVDARKAIYLYDGSAPNKRVLLMPLMLNV